MPKDVLVYPQDLFVDKNTLFAEFQTNGSFEVICIGSRNDELTFAKMLVIIGNGPNPPPIPPGPNPPIPPVPPTPDSLTGKFQQAYNDDGKNQKDLSTILTVYQEIQKVIDNSQVQTVGNFLFLKEKVTSVFFTKDVSPKLRNEINNYVVSKLSNYKDADLIDRPVFNSVYSTIVASLKEVK